MQFPYLVMFTQIQHAAVYGLLLTVYRHTVTVVVIWCVLSNDISIYKKARSLSETVLHFIDWMMYNYSFWFFYLYAVVFVCLFWFFVCIFKLGETNKNFIFSILEGQSHLISTIKVRKCLVKHHLTRTGFGRGLGHSVSQTNLKLVHQFVDFVNNFVQFCSPLFDHI